MAVTYSNIEYKRPPTQFPGYYRINKITINGIDVVPQMLQLDIYEDIERATMSGSITLLDTTNLIKNIPIIGEEEIEISVDDEINELNLKFMIYKISDRKQIKYGTLSYNLHFCSKEEYINSFKRVSKSYNLVYYEDAVIDIMQTYLQSEKEILFDKTRFQQCFIIPNWNGLNAVKWMSSRAQSETEKYNGNFIFFENKDSFNFLTIENLFDDEKNKVYAKISIDPLRNSVDKMHAYDNRIPDDTMRFESVEVIKSFDILEQSAFGMYKNKLRVTDLTTRENIDYEYDYLRDFKNTLHLKGKLGEEFPVASSNNLATKDVTDTEFRHFVIQKGLFTNEVDTPYHTQEWNATRNSQMLQMDNFKIQGVLPGSLEMKAGMIIYFDYPNIENISINNSETTDILYSGNYLITALRRTFQKDKFFNTIEMIRDNMSLSFSGTEV